MSSFTLSSKSEKNGWEDHPGLADEAPASQGVSSLFSLPTNLLLLPFLSLFHVLNSLWKKKLTFYRGLTLPKVGGGGFSFSLSFWPCFPPWERFCFSLSLLHQKTLTPLSSVSFLPLSSVPPPPHPPLSYGRRGKHKSLRTPFKVLSRSWNKRRSKSNFSLLLPPLTRYEENATEAEGEGSVW